MKRFLINIFCVASVACGLSSCEKDLPLYDTPDNRLNFDISVGSDTLVTYSFYYRDNIQRDTVWLRLHTVGFVADHDRQFELEQVMTGENDAQAGVQYESFDSPAMQQLYYVPAGQATAVVPVVLIRDASLKQQQYVLKIKVKPNAEFIEGFQQKRIMYITISDFLSKPSGWGYMTTYLFGAYGVVKHQFMIEATGMKWDNDFLNDIAIEVNNSQVRDGGYITYLNGYLRNALKELNAKRNEQGLGNLTEADGTEVTIPVASIN